MATIEERTSHLEARMDELTRTTTEIKSMLAALDQKMDRRFDALEARIEGRFTGVESRFTAVETRFNQWFLSMVGLQVMTLLAIVAGLFGIVTKLL